ncbi:MAG: sterol desaturase family protein [Dyadobacter sp.]|uniref:sterol desaturase family protein n=1 Tax=Dyadobacter sp. TaxID=1914288 RepID=UPI0032672B52
MKNHIGPYRIYILLFLVVLITAEMIWSWKKDKGAYQVKETVSNLAVFAGFQFSKYFFAGYQLGVLGFLAVLAPWKLPHSACVFCLTFLTADFIYYWFHRISHRYKPLWAFHLVHHSAMRMNLTTAYRLNWFSAIISPLFFIPAAVLGLPPDFIVISYTLNLVYQFFLHTEAVGKLGIIEHVLDTPSSHRVHHGSNPIYLDKNFGGVLIVWDKLFGTYQPETEKVKYGLATGFLSYNPFTLVFHGFVSWLVNPVNLKDAPIQNNSDSTEFKHLAPPPITSNHKNQNK